MYVAAVIIAAGFVLFYCSYQIRLGAYVRTLCRNRAAGRVVALTFDDGPDPEMTPRVLDLLRERGVRATFFLVGAKAGGASTNTGNGYELEAIAACTIGGVSTNGGVGKVSGVLVGKPMDDMYHAEYKKLLVSIIANKELPILCNINVGHAQPRCILPFGVRARVDAGEQVIRFG